MLASEWFDPLTWLCDWASEHPGSVDADLCLREAVAEGFEPIDIIVAAEGNLVEFLTTLPIFEEEDANRT
jgi:hypothetical protein